MSARMRSHTFFSPFHMFHSIRNVYTSKSNSKRLLDVETDFIIQSNISFLFLLSFELEFCFFFDHFYSIWKWKLTEQSIKLLDLNVIWGGGLANYCVKKKKIWIVQNIQLLDMLYVVDNVYFFHRWYTPYHTTHWTTSAIHCVQLTASLCCFR